MRPDSAERHATRKEGAKDQAKDLDQQPQPQSAHREQDERAHDQAGQGRVRSQDPNFGRGHH